MHLRAQMQLAGDLTGVTAVFRLRPEDRGDCWVGCSFGGVAMRRALIMPRRSVGRAGFSMASSLSEVGCWSAAGCWSASFAGVVFVFFFFLLDDPRGDGLAASSGLSSFAGVAMRRAVIESSRLVGSPPAAAVGGCSASAIVSSVHGGSGAACCLAGDLTGVAVVLRLRPDERGDCLAG